MNTENTAAQQEAFAMLYRVDGKLQLGIPCKTRSCAEQSVSPMEGADVIGVASLLAEPVKGMKFALRRRSTPSVSGVDLEVRDRVGEEEQDGVARVVEEAN